MKPSNVMVTGDNQLKLIDFGIARIFKTSATKDTTLLGSQGYAPLEQYGRSQSDPRSDIYALGATLYHLLTGIVPADAPTRRVNPQVFLTPRQLNKHISQASEEIVLMAMEQDPDERFQSAEAMRKAILQEQEAKESFAPYSRGLAPQSPLSPKAPSTMGDAQHTQEASTPARSTFENTILPIAIDIGSTIYQAIKENSSKRVDSNDGSTEYASQSTTARQIQMMAPAPAAPAASPANRVTHDRQNTYGHLHSNVSPAGDNQRIALLVVSGTLCAYLLPSLPRSVLFVGVCSEFANRRSIWKHAGSRSSFLYGKLHG